MADEETDEFEEESENYENDENDSALDSSTSYAPNEKLYENLQFEEETCLTASTNQHAEELRIMLLGARGSGKSSTGNTILRRDAFNTDMQLSRVTQSCERASGIINGRPVAIIDTPGLNKINRMEKDMTREIQSSLSLYSPGPHVFLLVMPVGNLTHDDKSMHRLMERMFGESVWRYTIIVFTHGDRLEGKEANDVIARADQALRDFIHKCSGGFLFFDNKDARNYEPVNELLRKVETLVAINGKRCYSPRLYPASERRIRKKMEKILETRKEEIEKKERDLTLSCRNELEIQRRQREIWRTEEREARKTAEKHRIQIKTKSKLTPKLT